ncbi:MAG: enoyl-CoA hydratase, partial [Bacteriovorax sp.]|nr:enoyl-CoA hydratase [Rhizobacter sp.]
EGRTAVSDPALTAIATELAAQHGILRRASISSEEIVERPLYPLFNEGLKIVAEGIAYRPGDVDVVWVAGYGFPGFRGGPMWMADNIGLRVIAARLQHYAQTLGNAYGYWTPSSALIHL